MSTATDMTTATSEDTTVERCKALVEQAGRVPDIKDDETNGRAGDLVKFLGAAAKKLDEVRDAKVRPLNEQVKEINASFKPLATALAEAKRAVQSKQAVFLTEKEAELRRLARESAAKAEADALEAAAAAEASGDTDAAALALEQAVAVPTPPTQVKVTTHGNYGSTTSFRSTWSAKVTDFAALPDTFKLPDLQSLGALARSSRPTIPGVEWVETKTAVTR